MALLYGTEIPKDWVINTADLSMTGTSNTTYTDVTFTAPALNSDYLKTLYNAIDPYVSLKQILTSNPIKSPAFDLGTVATIEDQYPRAGTTATGDWGLFYNYNQVVFNNSNYILYNPDPKEAKRAKFRINLAPKASRGTITGQTPAEQVARETLREIITETEFRRYMRYGFIMVKARSGEEYQVFQNKSHTRVWKNGEIVREICIRLKTEVPSTDNVIAFKTMIETDEQEFEKLGNVYHLKAA